jgi:hypothetical protein
MSEPLPKGGEAQNFICFFPNKFLPFGIGVERPEQFRLFGKRITYHKRSAR